MKNKKLYFSREISPEMAYSKEYLLNEMNERNLTEIKIFQAVREVGVSHYFCKAFGEVGMKGDEYDSCGKECDCYKPRNGKSGCCKHRGFCYEYGNEFKLNTNGVIN